jgi:hypothetical protein
MPGRQISSRVSAALTQRTRWRSLLCPQGTTPFGGPPPAATRSSSERSNLPRKPVGLRAPVAARPIARRYFPLEANPMIVRCCP